MNSIYFIIDIADLSQDMIDRSKQDNPFTIRKSIDGTKVILKFSQLTIPLEIYNLGYSQYSESQILNEIDTSGDW